MTTPTEQLYDMEHQAFLLGWEVIKYIHVPGDGIQAPGFVTMCKIDNLQHPFVVHFFNAQDGGFHSGNYCKDRSSAEEAYTKRALRFLGLTEDLQCPECGRDYKGDEELKAGDKCPSDDCH